MTTYTLKVSIDPSHIPQFQKNGFRLCVANGVNSFDKLNFDVIASASAVYENVMISFKDEYKMAATKDAFSGGAEIVVLTSLEPIKFGQSYTLPKDWTDGTVESDPNAPDNGFLFINQTPSAACVLFKNFAGQFNPIYTTVAGPVPPGTEAIVPTEKLSVWFQVGNEQPGTKVLDDFKTTSITVDFNGTTTHSLKYDADGNWVIVE